MKELSYFKNQAYHFYPKGLCAFKNKSIYEETNEFNRIKKSILDKSGHYDFFELKKELETKLNKKIYDLTQLNWLDRSYNLQFRVGEIKNKVFVLCINLSILIPYFICYILENEFDHKHNRLKFLPRRNFIVEKEEFKKDMDFVKNKIIDKTKYKEFPKELLYIPIPDINFQDIDMGKFNYFNAFFLNDYFTNIKNVI